MVAVEFRFLNGQYHATPWGNHVNEAAVEWPPSPWRILRALLSVWHCKLPDLPEASVRRVIAALTDLPSFCLPPASVGHTRHYMPLGTLDPKGPLKTTKVFDAFVSLPKGAAVVALWPEATLSPEDLDTLARLLENMSYLGRAESWIEARLVPAPDATPNCLPADAGAQPATGAERITVLAPVTEIEFAAQRQRTIETKTAELLDKARGAKLKKGQDPDTARLGAKELASVDSAFPPDLFTALHADTPTLQKQGWSAPPGSRKVAYYRPARALEHHRVYPRLRVAPRHPTVARYALSGPVLPLLTECVYVAETMRQALMKWSDAAEVFAGKDAEGRPLQGHRHAFFLPADDDNDGRLDHICVYASMGFDERAQRALGGVQRLWQARNRPDLQVVLVGLGDPGDYGGFAVRDGQTPQLASSRVWVSRTPFLLTRHPHFRKDGQPRRADDGDWLDGPQDQMCRLLRQQDIPEPTAISHVLATSAGGKALRWLQFARERRSGTGAVTSPLGYGFRVEFAQPVSGPLAVGYGCHFGLGQFRAEPG